MEAIIRRIKYWNSKSEFFWDMFPQSRNVGQVIYLFNNPEVWDGEGGGRGVHDWGHMYTHGWFMSMYGKKHYNIVK